MKQEIIQQGAEAVIFLKDNFVVKDRIEKHYRIKKIDSRIREQRTRREIKLLQKSGELINVPRPIPIKEKTKIIMPFIEGKKLSEHLDNFSEKEAEKICTEIGKALAKIHDAGIIHGDLTTSNMIFDKDEKLWFIDFGLGFFSERIEDKAVDLHLIKQALEAKHFLNWEEHYKNILKGYKESRYYERTVTQLKKVEARGRYKGAG